MASSDPSNSDPAQVLNYILNSIPPATFVARLRAALDPAMGYDSEDIQSLLDGLANVGFERAVKQAARVVEQGSKAAEDGMDEQHCVRCHKEYRETENGYEACKIQHTHTYTSATLKTATHAHERCLSCHKVPPPSAIVEEKCITARHTTNVKDIKERSALLRTCVEAGCGRKAPTTAAKLLDGSFESAGNRG
ncbi:hypothetical protein FA13DRAFT_161582 [Coprinellus micaceus]|uniref:Uncharacterized protein n=1 Tax=Coprinellus micaceus TaxID=71717 RepID=A0A4Y7THC3_COPMI|nr:hypothetical protein FA13DRAFT_161582 [Coprinellus micaceus]